MYLKSIEIQGFKSFAHKTLLNFNNGVTAIVGPNGSGKSNISDAVRWVLGEQKVKQLRGSAMQDVIFAGTEARKPQGFAYVAITLDNSDRALGTDYEEVTVSRRLFRSGESEYLINGQNVRLKDVQEMFYDTGIGKEGYSIIGQGQIDAILNGRPEDRRGLFDEAAGIVKFKKRKLTALKKLENEQSNLQRISDITDELEKRLKPLEKQQESARKYLKLIDEQKKLELNLFVRDTDEILKDLERLETDMETVRYSIEDCEKEKAGLAARHNDISEKITGLDSLISRKKELISKAELLKENLKGQIELRESGIRSGNETMERLKAEISRLKEEISAQKKSIGDYLSGITELSDSLKLIKQQDAQGAELSGDIPELEEKLDKLKISILENVPDAGSNITCSEHKDVSEQTDDEDEPGYNMPDWLMAIKNKRDDLSDIREREEKTLNWISLASSEYNELTMKLKELQNELITKQREYSDLNARYDSLKNIAERYEGFGESVRAVMRSRTSLRGVHGVVADIVKTDKRFEQAIETALGGRIQNIVTETEEDAKKCVEFLKKSRQGRATFLPLDAVRGRRSEEYDRALREKGVIGIGSGLIKCSDEYKDVVEFLLGSVLVVDNMDNALKIAGKYRHSIRMVTLEGELLSPGGAITGGAFKNSANLIGRSRQIDEMRIKRTAAAEALGSVRDDIALQESRINEKSGELDRLNASLKDIESEKKELSLGILSDMRLKLGEVKQKIGFIEENVGRAVSGLRSAVGSAADIEDDISSLKLKLKESEDEIALRKSDLLKADEDIERSKEELKAHIEEKEELSGSEADFYKRKEEIDSDLLELQKEMLRLESRQEKDKQKLDSCTEHIWEEYEISLNKAREAYDEGLGSISSIRSGLQAVRAGIKELGPVNVQAIEEYKEVSERYSFLEQQRQDLLRSAEAVTGIIEELDREMKKQFGEQFKLIREKFREVFRELFGGGNADLELVYDMEEEGDELEAGIAINAQPPGKKLQNILQLSGGEKALTAISLLFAIQSLKPSPFCLLDEIEAALDDSNVVRFARYLHRLTDVTQFIVITHRRGTMEEADRLYGVTMQEKGISKLVSVDLVSDQLS